MPSASFLALGITAAGIDMQAQAQAGGTLQFTRLAVGAGAAADPSSATALVDQKLTANIQRFSPIVGGRVEMLVVLSNLDLTTGFSMSEVGLFALDPTTHVERLYSYSKTTTPDYMPAYSAPSTVEQEIKINVAVGSASSVTAILDDTVLLATKWDSRNPTNREDLSSVPATVSFTVRQNVGGSYVDTVKVMGFGALAIPYALAAVPTPPAGYVYLYARSNGQASPNARTMVCTKLPDDNEVVMGVGDPS